MTGSGPANGAADSARGARATETELHLLVVDDEQADRLALKRALRQAGVAGVVEEAVSAAEVRERMLATAYDCVFLDYLLPGTDTVALLREIREFAPTAPVIIITGHGGEEVAVELMKAGAIDYLPKGSLTPERIESSLRHARQLARAAEARRRAEAELRASEERERFLAEASQVLASSLEGGRALEALADLVVPARADFCVFDVIGRGGEVERAAYRHADPSRTAWLAEVPAFLSPDTSARPPTEGAARPGAPEFIPEVTEEWLAGESSVPEQQRFLRELGVRALVRVPVVAEERTAGMFAMGLTGSGRHYTEADALLAAGIARRAAVAYHNATLLRQAREAVRVRDEVTSIVSHDLRNAVNTIYMASAFMLEAELDAALQRKQVEVIHRGATQMARLLDDLVDVAKAEAGMLAVEMRPEPADALLREASEAFQLRAAEPGLTVRAEIPRELPPVIADRQRILQVLSNLIGNALKFTPAGGSITLRAEPAEGTVVISVADTGIGISEADLPRVFDRFWQARRASRASAGLGLAIARSIVEAHGGRIWVESAEGQGTTFRFTLPAAPSRPEPA